MVKDVYNIYMTFPSDVKVIKEGDKVLDSSVSRVEGLELRDEFGEILTTSETAIKYLLKKKIENEQEVDFTLDRVFLLVSDTVAKKIGFESDITKKRPPFDVNTTHLDVLCHQMDCFYESYFNKQITPSFSEIKKVIPCGDSLDDTKQLGDNIIKLCEQIIAYKAEVPLDSKIKLYIDTSGGFRNAAMLFLIVGRIMSYMGIEVANIYYTSWVKGVCTVHEIKDTYDLLDLIAGFEEFLMFGSAKKLNDHYKINDANIQDTQRTSNQKSIDELLKAMNKFSDVINISRRGEFKSELSLLNQTLSQIHFDYNSAVEGFNYQLIKFLREPIEKEYTSLFKQKSVDTMDELSYVEWCLKHDYVQQALTLFKECVPDFLIKKGVIVVDDAKFSNYIKNKKLKAEMNILETALNKWNAMHPKRHSNNLFKLDEFLNTYTDGIEPMEDVRDDADLVFNEINEYRAKFISKYTNREELFKKLSAILKAYVTEVQNKEFITNKESLDIDERNEILGDFLKFKQEEVLECMFNEIRAYKLVPVKDESSHAQKIISFITAITMNVMALKNINSLPYNLREMLYKGNSTKLQPYVPDEDNIHFIFEDEYADIGKLRVVLYKILKNHINDKILFSDITKGFILKEYDFEQEAKDIFNNYNKALYKIPGVSISEKFEGSLAKVIEVFAYYFEIKKARNDTNHARIEETSQFTTSSEIKAAMTICIKFIRDLTE